MVLFSMTLNNSNPNSKGTPLLDIE